jgi:hypothetical protein
MDEFMSEREREREPPSVFYLVLRIYANSILGAFKAYIDSQIPIVFINGRTCICNLHW